MSNINLKSPKCCPRIRYLIWQVTILQSLRKCWHSIVFSDRFKTFLRPLSKLSILKIALLRVLSQPISVTEQTSYGAVASGSCEKCEQTDTDLARPTNKIRGIYSQIMCSTWNQYLQSTCGEYRMQTSKANSQTIHYIPRY